MCLVFRTIVLLSLNWWVVSVVAQEQKQDVMVTDTSALLPLSSATQAQQLLSENKELVQELVATDTIKQPVAPVISVVPAQSESSLQTDSTQPVSLVATDTTKQAELIIPVVLVKPELVLGAKKEPVEAQQLEEVKVLQQEVNNVEQGVENLEQEIKNPEEEVALSSQEMENPEQQAEEVGQANVPGQEVEKEEALSSPEMEKEEVEKSQQEIEKETAAKAMPEEEATIKGIDTVDLDEPRGNWLFKKIWWGRAENKYEKIRAVFENILESRILFFTKRSTADKDLFAPFYFEIGMNNGELQEIVSQLISHIENERKKGELSPSSREIFNVLMSEKKSLESINAAVLAVNKLDIDIDETLKKLMEQIDRARKYEQEAWRNFKDIGRVLSDTKARELYYQMDTAYNNIKDIQEYVGQALIVHLDRVVGTAKNQTERIKATINALNKKGHDLRTLADQVSGKIQKTPLSEEQEDEENIEPEEELGFFGTIFSSIKSSVAAVWDSIVYVVTLPFSWFSSGDSNEHANEEEFAEEEVEVMPEEEEKN